MQSKPNVVFIYADDLGRGLLSCYGQKQYNTPNIDRIYNNGMRFNNAYGCHICAPARASLLCGVHDSHCGRWQFNRAGIYKDYARGELSLEQVYELIHNTGIDLRSQGTYLPTVFKRAGYTTGQIGKLEWGFATTGDEIKAHGWDYHYGYYDHEMCHGYYPPFVFEDGVRVDIPGNEAVGADCGKDQYNNVTFQKNGNDMENGRAVYCQDLFDQKIIEFLDKHHAQPFFMMHPTMLPHGALSIPELDPQVANRKDLTLSEKVYASMVLRLDHSVGLILAQLERHGIMANTMVVFASDNGHCCYYSKERSGIDGNTQTLDGHTIDHLQVRFTSDGCGDVFDGNDGMTGCKSTNFEGGTRVPLMIMWPEQIEPSTTDRLVANYDFISTVAELVDGSEGEGKDGVSYLPLLLGNEKDFQEHDYVVFASARGPALVTKDGWKVRSYITDTYSFNKFGAFWEEIEGKVLFELYNLREDYREEHNLADQYPDKLRELRTILMRECDGNVINGTTQPHFVFYGYDYRNQLREQKET